MSESSKKYAQLGSDAQREVEGIRQTIFYRWPTPKVPADAMVDWEDDLAVLYIDFGFRVVSDAVSWHRQNTERRPSIPQIREQCKLIRTRTERTVSSSDKEHREYEAQVRQHIANPRDTSFVPFALVWRDFHEYQRLLAQCRARGVTPTQMEVDAWWDDRDARTDKEWSELRAQGVKGLVLRGGPLADNPTRRRGAEDELTPASLTGSLTITHKRPAELNGQPASQLSLDTTTR
jgi:hypothetical protein